MKTRLQHIKIRNFKAFRDFEISLEGRHLLVFGENGSGKSSLYWALYTFLQSARKPKNSIAKYFDPTHDEKLLNLHEQKEPTPKTGEIALTLRDVAGNDVVFSISHANHGTHEEPAIVKGALASDFITYRFFFGFSDFKNSDDFNIWPLFEKEILPFCVATGVAPGEYEENWIKLQKENPNPNYYRGRAGAKAFRDFNSKLEAYCNKIAVIVDGISNEAQAFYNYHFAEGDKEPITLKLKITASAHYSQPDEMVLPPILKFGIKVGSEEIKKPQSYLNEAKMTQLALSVRFASSRVNLHESDLKLLVLDDLLVSLDMSNRMKVVKILLSPGFSNYQKIILTHDKGFYSEFRRRIGFATENWSFQRLHAINGEAPTLSEDPAHITWATSLMKAGRYDEAALQLRKAAEDFLRDFVKKAYSAEKFISLSEMLEDARQQTDGLLLKKLFAVLEGWETAENVTLDRLLPPNMEDIIGDETLSQGARQQLCRRRASLRSLVGDLHKRHRETGQILEQIEHIKDRILNPAAHASETPLYQAEIEEAIDLIKKLKTCLE